MTVGQCLTKVSEAFIYPIIIQKVNYLEIGYSGSIRDYSPMMTMPDIATVSNGVYSTSYTIPISIGGSKNFVNESATIQYGVSQRNNVNCMITYCPLEFLSAESTYILTQYERQMVQGSLVNGVITFPLKHLLNTNTGFIILGISF